MPTTTVGGQALEALGRISGKPFKDAAEAKAWAEALKKAPAEQKGSSVFLADPVEKPAFSSLKDAVAFISRCLDQGDAKALSAACATPPADVAFENLRSTHLSTPLPKLYEGRDFPARGDTFSLGGHDKELGHIHIDFKRSGQGWQFSSIWVCW